MVILPCPLQKTEMLYYYYKEPHYSPGLLKNIWNTKSPKKAPRPP